MVLRIKKQSRCQIRAAWERESGGNVFWTKEEFVKFIEAVKDKLYSYQAFEILYWCGLRVGKLLALTLQDLDFDSKVIRITKSYQRLEGKDVITDQSFIYIGF